jgi:hypothetical protein
LDCGRVFLIDQQLHPLEVAAFREATDNSFQLAAFFDSGYFLATTAGDVYLCEELATLEARKLTVLPRRTSKLAIAVSAFQPEDPMLLVHGPALYVDTLIRIQPTEDDEPTIRELSFPFTLYGIGSNPNQQLALVWSDCTIYIYAATFQEAMTKLCLPGDILSFGWCGSSSIFVHLIREMKSVPRECSTIRPASMAMSQCRPIQCGSWTLSIW